MSWTWGFITVTFAVHCCRNEQRLKHHLCSSKGVALFGRFFFWTQERMFVVISSPHTRLRPGLQYPQHVHYVYIMCNNDCFTKNMLVVLFSCFLCLSCPCWQPWMDSYAWFTRGLQSCLAGTGAIALGYDCPAASGATLNTLWAFVAETKWAPFSRRHFQVHFLEWKCLNSDEILLKFVPKGSINNIPALV